MSTKDESSQFLFLITCIKNSNNGKVDFEAVAEQLDIVSKGAAAKRYERLMKAHGVPTNGKSGPSTPKKPTVKKEKGGDSSKPPSKKRKLKEVDESAPDVDEPIKGEVKSEIKSEDAITVKAEQSNGGVAVMTVPAVVTFTEGEVHKRGSEDDEDEVLLISVNEKSDTRVPIYGSDHHHHHMQMSAREIPSIHSLDYAANMEYPLQKTLALSPTTVNSAITRTSSANVLPYRIAPFPFMHNHNTPGYFWRG